MTSDPKERANDIYISLAKAKEILGLPVAKITRLCRQGGLKAIKTEKEWITTEEWIKDYQKFLEKGNRKKSFNGQFNSEEIKRNIDSLFLPLRRYWHEAAALIMLVAMISTGFLFFEPPQVALGISYTWFQTSWAGGVSGLTASRADNNELGWTNYTSASSTLTIGTELTLAQTASSSLQTTDTDFSGGTHSSTAASSTTPAGDVILSSTTATPSCSGTDHGGAAWTPTNGDAYDLDSSANIAIAGDHCNVGAFSIPSGTVYVWANSNGASYGQLKIVATSINIAGTLYGLGKGSAGGGVDSSGTNTGSYGSAGGAGGSGGSNWDLDYDCNGTANSGGSSAGSTRGTSTGTDIAMGGGGAGGGSNNGAGATGGNAGGGSIYLWSSGTITVGGTINMNGGTGGTGGNGVGGGNYAIGGAGGGAGASGGGILIDGSTVTVSGTLSANGGAGGNGGSRGACTSGSCQYDSCSGGGGQGGTGGGGRIKLFGNTITTTGSSITVTGNSAGSYTTNARAGLVYSASGDFTSSAIDTGSSSGIGSDFTTLTWNAVTPASTVVKFQLRSAATSGGLSSATWYGPTGTGDYYTVSGTAINSTHDGDRYIQYKAYLSGDTTKTPELDDVTVNYQYYGPQGVLTSTPYNTGDDTNVFQSVGWSETLPSASTDVQFQVRTSPDNVTWTPWVGPDNGNNSSYAVGTYFTNPAGGETMEHELSDGASDRWIQYRVLLSTTNGAQTPTLADVTLTHLVNGPPNFDATYGTNGVTVSQISDSNSASWGKVVIQYKVRDQDNTSVTPSFQYNIGGGWQNITSGYLAAGDTSAKTVENSNYTIFSATWDAKTQIPGNYTSSAQVRVTVNDGELANNTSSTDSATFTLDTKAPSRTMTIDSSTSTDKVLSLNLSDNTNIQYKISNSSDFSADGLNGTSGSWQDPAAATYAVTDKSWTLTGSPSAETVYLMVRDQYGNSTTTTSTAPYTPTNFDIKDVSNVSSNQYREFVSWAVYSPATGAQFSKYEVYRATTTDEAGNYILVGSVSDINTNYYMDTTVASTTDYYYKVRIMDTDGDVSNFSSSASDKPNGQGGSDTTAPTISSVAAASVQATWMKITWTTDELANSRIDYSISPDTSFGSNASSTAMVTSHEITLSGLTPNTTYLYRVKSQDPSGNTATDSNGGGGYATTTLQGPTISEVTTESVNDSSATIIWNTNTSSNSYVVYATNLTNLKNGVSTSEVGSITRISTAPYQHRVSLSGLTSRTVYYFYVKSTDESGNLVTDTNGGNYYTFTTTYDTKAPVISAITKLAVTADKAVIYWETDELADSQVYYSQTSGSYTSNTDLDTTLSIGHIATLSSLQSGKTYYFMVKSSDAQGNSATSSEQSFETSSNGVVTVTVFLPSGGGGSSRDTTPPNISKLEVSDIGSFDAVVSFDTNEPTTGYVLYSTDATFGKIVADVDFKSHHEIKIFGLHLGTAYRFKVKAQDAGGNFGTSEEKTFTTKYAAESLDNLVTLENAGQFQDQLDNIIETIMPSLVPPFLEEPIISNITESAAEVSWRTNIPSFSVVSYASEEEYDPKKENPYVTEISDTLIKAQSHKMDLTGLKADTLYHLKAKSFILPGAMSESKDLTFATKSGQITPRALDIGKDSLNIAWKTERMTSSIVQYKNLNTGETIRKTDESLKSDHLVLLENLNPNTTYEIKSSGYDERGNLIESQTVRVKTSTDITPPVVSSIKIDSTLVPGRTDRVQTIIRWITNELANSAVFYGEGGKLGPDALANNIETPDVFVTDHVIIIPTLKPGMIYQIQIASVDDAGNKTVTPIRTIITPRYNESILDVITKNFQDTFQFLNNVK